MNISTKDIEALLNLIENQDAIGDNWEVIENIDERSSVAEGDEVEIETNEAIIIYDVLSPLMEEREDDGLLIRESEAFDNLEEALTDEGAL